MSIFNGDILDPGLKFIQLKNFQLTNANTSGSGQCLALDQNRQVVLACCENNLVYVPLKSLLNFDTWTKELLKTVDTQLAEKVTVNLGPDSLNCHLISISNRGYGTKFALCSYDRNQAQLFITFYDLNSVYLKKDKSVPYSKFHIPIVGQDEIRVHSLQWHPEMGDNIFACSLTNGTFYLVYISDSDRNVLTILAQYSTDRHVSSFTWSPKGKQIVLGFQHTAQEHFSQFKVTINEKNLNQNTPFEEVKKIKLPDEFHGYYVSCISWLSTFNFMIILNNPDNSDTHYMIASIPSAKATGDDAIMKVVDFACINIDSVEDGPFEAYCSQMENILFTFTNRSSGCALLGCSTSNDIAAYNKWAEIALEDDSNLMLPVLSNESFVSIRGLAFAPGTEKQFRFSPEIVKGGPNRHYILTYSGLGFLTVFMSDFENEANAQFFKIPPAPSMLIKPVISPSAPNQSTTPIASVPSVPTPPPQEQTPSFTFRLPNSQNKLSQPAKALPTAPSLPNFSSFTNAFADASQSQPQTNIPKTKDPSPPSSSTTLPKAQIHLSTNTISESVETASSSQNSKAEEPRPNLDKVFIEEIKTVIKDFNKELKDCTDAQKRILSNVSIGTSEQFETLKFELYHINSMLEKLSEYYTALNVDSNELEACLFEFHYLLKETRSLLDRNTDPKYKNILQQRSLDAITLRKLKQIHSLRDYINTQLLELDNKFEIEWLEWLQQRRMPKTLSKNGQTNVQDAAYTSKTLYKALNCNQSLIDSLKLSLSSAGLYQEKNLDKFSKIFNQSVNLSNGHHQQPKKTIILRCLPLEQKSLLMRFLENRKIVPIRICGPCESEDIPRKSSRFISLLEKIKQKQKGSPPVPAVSTVTAASEVVSTTTAKQSIPFSFNQSISQPVTTSSTSAGGLFGSLTSATVTTASVVAAAATKPGAIFSSAQTISGTSQPARFGISQPFSSSASAATTAGIGQPVVPTAAQEAKQSGNALGAFTGFGKSLSSAPIAVPAGSLFGAPTAASTAARAVVATTTTTTAKLGTSFSFNQAVSGQPATTSSTSTGGLFGSLTSATVTTASVAASTATKPGAIFSSAQTISGTPAVTSQSPSFGISQPFSSSTPAATTAGIRQPVVPTTALETKQAGNAFGAFTGFGNSLGSAPTAAPAGSLFGAPTTASTPASAVASTTTTTAAKQSIPFSFNKSISQPATTSSTSTGGLFGSLTTTTVTTSSEVASTATKPGAPFSFAQAISGMPTVTSQPPSFGISQPFRPSTPATTTAGIGQHVVPTTAQEAKPPTSSFFASSTSSTTATGFENTLNSGSTGPSSPPTAKPTASIFGTFTGFGNSLGSAPTAGSAGSLSAPTAAVTTASAAPSTTAKLGTSFSFNQAVSGQPATTSSTSTGGLFGSLATTTVTTANVVASTATKPGAPFSFIQASGIPTTASQPTPFGISQPFGSSAPVTTTAGIGGGAFSLLKPVAPTAQEAKPSSSSFFTSPPSSTASGLENTLNSFSICGPSSPPTAKPTGNAFGAFTGFGNSLGSAPTAASAGSPFGSPAASATTASGSIFASPILGGSSWGSASQQQQSNAPLNLSQPGPFSSPANKIGSFGFQTSAAPAASGFGGPPSFGNSPVFGQSPVLGGSTQTFGGAPTFGGGSSPFGSPAAFGVGGQTAFANLSNSNETFGSFAMKDADVPTFGSFAAGDAGQSSASAFNQFGSPSFGQEPSFTQRRK